MYEYRYLLIRVCINNIESIKYCEMWNSCSNVLIFVMGEGGGKTNQAPGCAEALIFEHHYFWIVILALCSPITKGECYYSEILVLTTRAPLHDLSTLYFTTLFLPISHSCAPLFLNSNFWLMFTDYIRQKILFGNEKK